MLSSLIASCLSNRWLIIVALAIVSGAGVYTAFNLQIDAFPDLSNNQITVITEAGPMAPDEVERLVSFPIETSLMGVPKLKELRSISKLGVSLVTIVIDDSVDLYFARQLINERLREARSRLPKGLEPVLGPVATAFGEIYQYTIEGGGLSLLERKTLQDWVIRPQLRTVPGINEVNSWGGFSKQYTVEVDPQSLSRIGLTVRDVMNRLAMSNINFGGGFIEHQSEQYNVLGLGRFNSPEDIEKVVLVERAGVSIKVRDVAKVKIEGALRQGAVIRNTNESVCGMAIMLRGENSLATLDRVKQRLASIQLPKGVQLIPFYDQSEVIDITLKTVQRNLIEAGLLVAVILFVFLGEIRAALIVAAIIPFSMLFGFMGMAFFGISVNLMSLGAIDFGMIVDGAVVMMENIIRRLHLDGHKFTRIQLIREAAQEVSKPILFGVLIIIAVYLPVLFLQDLEGRMFRPMAISVVSALFGSLLLALFGVPVLASLFLTTTVQEKESRWFHAVEVLYRRLLRIALHWRWVTIAAALLLLAGAIGSVAYIGTEFMPRLDEGMILIQTKMLPGVNVTLSVESSRQVQRILLRFPEVDSVTSKLGRPDVATEAMGVHESDLYINLKEDKKWLRPEQKADLINRMAVALKEMPGMEFNFTMPMAMRLDETISGIKADVAYKIFGEDTATLERLAEKAEKALTKIPGVADLQTEVITGVAEIRVDPDRNSLARYGLTIEDVQSAIDASSGGIFVSEFVEGQRRFPIMLRFPAYYREDISHIGDIFIKAPGGEQVRLNEIARIEAGRGAEIIQRENGMKRIVVQFNVRGRDLGSVVAEAQSKLKQNIQLPSGYLTSWGGQFENQARATKRLALVLPLSLLLILSLLYATFKSLPQSLLILCAVPFSAIGGIGMLWFRGMNLNLSASIGFIALFGVAVLNGIVLVSTINQLREDANIRNAVEEGAVQRLRPVLMTALVAAFGFLPMAFSTMPGSEVQRPLASVVVGGLFSATLLTLVLVPVLYPLFTSAKSFAPAD